MFSLLLLSVLSLSLFSLLYTSTLSLSSFPLSFPLYSPLCLCHFVTSSLPFLPDLYFSLFFLRTFSMSFNSIFLFSLFHKSFPNWLIFSFSRLFHFSFHSPFIPYFLSLPLSLSQAISALLPWKNFSMCFNCNGWTCYSKALCRDIC